MKIYGPIFVDLRKKQREEKKIKIILSPRSLSVPHVRCSAKMAFSSFLFDFFFIILLFNIRGSYCFIRVRFCPETIYLFSVHLILNKLNPNHFLTSEIFLKILSLKSLATYHPENRKIFRMSQNSMKLLWVTRFRETNLTAQSVSSSEI